MKIFEIGEKYYLKIQDYIIPYSISIFERHQQVNGNVVCIDLLRYGYEVYVGKSGNKEIDFIASKDDHKVYIQVAYMLPDDATVRREFGNLLEIADNYPKYVVTMDEMQSGGNYKGIKQISLRNFCWQRIKKDCKSII